MSPLICWGTALFYRSELPKEKVLAIHNDVLDILNILGEEGADLGQAFSRLTLHLAIQRFIEKQVDLYEDDNRAEEPGESAANPHS